VLAFPLVVVPAAVPKNDCQSGAYPTANNDQQLADPRGITEGDANFDVDTLQSFGMTFDFQVGS
jgi:hypothetical protein